MSMVLHLKLRHGADCDYPAQQRARKACGNRLYGSETFLLSGAHCQWWSVASSQATLWLVFVTKVKVHFRDFWPGFSPNSFFLPVVEKALGRVSMNSQLFEADIVIESVFPRKLSKRRLARLIGVNKFPSPTSKRNKKRKEPFRIWYTGENIRPPVSGHDLSLSFDVDSYDETNVYWPLIYLSLSWFRLDEVPMSLEFERAGYAPTPLEVSQGRSSATSERKGFLCAFVGNAEPIRMRALEALTRLGQVDIYGAAVGRPVKEKHVVSKNYRFSLCFENDIYPGYVTEKALDAHTSQCVPIWRGEDAAGILNPDAIINAKDFAEIRQLVDYVGDVNRSSDLVDEIVSRPLLREEPSLDPLMQALQRCMT